MPKSATAYSYYPMDTYRRVLQVVQTCEAMCENTFSSVLGMCDQARVMQIRMLCDCADMCALTAKYIARCSMFAKQHAGMCANICEMCGNHCLMQPDAQSQECGRICLECAKECSDFAGMNMPYGRAWAPGYGFFGKK